MNLQKHLLLDHHYPQGKQQELFLRKQYKMPNDV
jgi:hypothetical protein